MGRGETLSVFHADTAATRVRTPEDTLSSADEQDDVGEEEEELWPDLTKRIEALFTEEDDVPGGEIFGQQLQAEKCDSSRPAMRRPPQVRSPSASPARPTGIRARQSAPCPLDASLPAFEDVPSARPAKNSNFSKTPVFGDVSPATPYVKGRFSRPTAAAELASSGVGTSPSPENGSTSFRVDTLGIPAHQKGRAVQVDSGKAKCDNGTDVMYIHIPRHALKGFQSFARNVASECRRDNATDNPYVRALCNHRAELHHHSVIPCPTEAPSLAQQMGSEREALSVMMPAEMPVFEPATSVPSSCAERECSSHERASHERGRRECSNGEAWLTAWPPCSTQGTCSTQDITQDGDANRNGCMLWRCTAEQEESWSLHVDPRGVESGQSGYTAICSGYTPRRDPKLGFSSAGSPLRPVAPKPHQQPMIAQSPLSPRILYPVEQDESSLDDYL